MRHELRLFVIALASLTRLRPPATVGVAELRQSARHHPGAGLLIGAFAALALWLAAHAWPAPVTVLLAVAAGIWLTEARGEAALARWLALGRGAAADAPAAGLLLAVAVLAGKVLAVHGLGVRDLVSAMAALPLAQAWSRTAAVVLQSLLAPPHDDATDQTVPMPAVPDRTDGFALLVALAWALWAAGLGAVVYSAQALTVAAATLVGAAVLLLARLRRAPRRLDATAAAAVQQLGELVVLLALLAAVARGL